MGAYENPKEFSLSQLNFKPELSHVKQFTNLFVIFKFFLYILIFLIKKTAYDAMSQSLLLLQTVLC